MPLKQVHQEHAHAIAHFTPELAQLFNLLQVLHIQPIPAIPEPLRTSPAQKPPSGPEVAIDYPLDCRLAPQSSQQVS